MIRLLHLIPSQADFQTRRMVEQLSKKLGDPWVSISKTVGPGGDFRNVLTAALALRRDPYQIIHSWGSAPLAAVTLAGAKQIVFSPLPELRLPGSRWLNILSRRSFAVAASDPMIASQLIRRGVSASHCQTIFPPIDLNALPGPSSELRAELGLSDSDFVLLAPGESTPAAAHYRALWIVSILHVLDTRFRLLIWGRGSLVDSLQRFAGRLRQDRVLVVAEERLGRGIDFEFLPSLVNTALIASSGFPAALPIIQCMAAGLPIIHGGAGIAAQILPAGAALAVSPALPRSFSQTLLELRDHSKLQTDLSAWARVAAQRFSIDQTLDRWRNIYRQSAGIPTEPLQPHPAEDTVLS